MRYYVMLQLKSVNGRGINGRTRGSVWTTSFTPAFLKVRPGNPDELAQELAQSEHAEVLCSVNGKAALTAMMELWHASALSWPTGIRGAKWNNWRIEAARKFFTTR